MSLVSLVSKPCEETLAAKPQGDDSRGLLLVVASSSSLLAGASGLLVEELLAAGGFLVGASGSSLLAGASGVLVEELLAAGASGSNLLAGASGSSLLAGASGFMATLLVGLVGQRFFPHVDFVATCDRLLSRRSDRVGHDGLEVGDSGHRIRVGGGGQMSRR
jgi:hypothetical protein